MAEITKRELRVAKELAHQHGIKWLNHWCLDHPVLGWSHGAQCMGLTQIIAQALANHAAEARREENRECEEMARTMAATRFRGAERIAHAVEKSIQRDLGHELVACADAIAARRGGHG